MDYKNVREQVTDRIREEILFGNFQQGEALREIPLAERLKVSRGPIRDAFLQLAQEGLLEMIPNKGVRVGKVWDAKMLPVMAQVRFELESFAISELIGDPSDVIKESLTHNLRMFKLACEDDDMSSIVRLDLAFHRIFLKGCGHLGLETVWLPLLGGFRLPYSRHKSMSETYEEHKLIADSCISGRKKDTLNALKQNILSPFLK